MNASFFFPNPGSHFSTPAFLQLWFFWGFKPQPCYWDHINERPPYHNIFFQFLKYHWYLKNKHLFQNYSLIVSNNCCYSLKDQYYHPWVRTSLKGDPKNHQRNKVSSLLPVIFSVQQLPLFPSIFSWPIFIYTSNWGLSFQLPGLKTATKR